jgi:hypothetical protein
VVLSTSASNHDDDHRAQHEAAEQPETDRVVAPDQRDYGRYTQDNEADAPQSARVGRVGLVTVHSDIVPYHPTRSGRERELAIVSTCSIRVAAR